MARVDEHFAGKTVWVTGASSGIGEAIALAFSDVGARVVLSARREPVLEQVRQRLADPDRSRIVPFDAGDAEAVQRAVAQVLEDEGHVDVMVHAAGITQRARALETDIAVDRRIMELNFFAAVAMAKGLVPAMVERGHGHVCVISSVAGKVGTPLRSAYAASKHALHGWFDSLRAEVYDQGVRVCIVCPGYVNTPILQSAMTADGSPMKGSSAKISSGISPERVAQATLRGIAREENEVYVGGRELAGIYAQRLAPDVVARLIRRVKTT